MFRHHEATASADPWPDDVPVWWGAALPKLLRILRHRLKGFPVSYEGNAV
jgi:hypothetical protein